MKHHRTRAVVSDARTSNDGTQKLLPRLADGASIEAVLIPDGERLTLLKTAGDCAPPYVVVKVRTRGGSAGRYPLGLPHAREVGPVNRRVVVAARRLSREEQAAAERLRENVVFLAGGAHWHIGIGA